MENNYASRTVKALGFTIEEFNEICGRVLGHNIHIECGRSEWEWKKIYYDKWQWEHSVSEWHWASDKKIDKNEIKEKLETEFGREISGFRMNGIFVDTINEIVTVYYR